MSDKPKSGRAAAPTVMGDGKKLVLPLTLEDGHVPGMLRNLTFLTGLIVACGIGWAALAEVRELAVASGEVVPNGSVRNIHHLEGGIVAEILTDEGQIVEPGTPLIRMRANSATNDLKQLQTRATILKLRQMRLAALLRNEPFSPGELETHHPVLVSEQQALHDAQLSLRQHEERTLNARIKQREADLAAASDTIDSLAGQLRLANQQVTRLADLVAKNLASRSALQSVQAEHEKLLAQKIVAQGNRITAQAGVDEAKSVYLEARVKAHKQYSEEMAQISAEFSELEYAIQKQTDRVVRLDVRSPVRGIVHQLSHRSAGAVIKPGDTVAQVVPIDEQLVAEVQLDPKDIGHVAIGAQAELKISTFDPNVFGVVKGRVDKLSASTLQTEQGEAYYKATISLEQNWVGKGPAPQTISPGMTVQADIVTGSKSLIRYMLKPVYRSLTTAFTER